MNFDVIAHRDKFPFQEIINKNKTKEYRLNDEKRQKLQIGNIIKLVNRENENEFVLVKVIGLSHFKDFINCFTVFTPKTYEEEIINKVYSKERIEKYGVIVIHFKLVDEVKEK